MNLSFRYRFEAAHRLTASSAPSCQTPHGHTWHVTLTLASQVDQLNAEDMVYEFQKTKKKWKHFIHDKVDHHLLINSSDPILPSLKEHIPNLRYIPFPGDPTTELIAILFLKKAQSLIDTDKVRPQKILIEETPVNSVEVNIDHPIFSNTISTLETKKNQKFKTAGGITLIKSQLF